MFRLFEGELSPVFEIKQVSVETPAEHLARIDAKAKELRDGMKSKWLCDPVNQVRRLDGKVYGSKPATVRLLKREKQAA